MILNHQHFINLIVAEKENSQHVLIYADWLEEQGIPLCQSLRPHYSEVASWLIHWSNMRSDYDWKEAFGYAGEPGTNATANLLEAVPGSEIDANEFRMEDVFGVVAESTGENDGDSWICYGVLKDNRWFFLEAWCDYTGWDCQAGGSASIASNREECERFALTDQARHRLSVVLES